MDEEKKVIAECCEELSRAAEEKEEEEKVHQSSCKKLCLALSIVLSLAVSRGCGAQLKFSILNDQPEQFYPPFLLMWFNNCCLLACFPGFLLFEKLLNSRRRKRTKSSSIREVFDKSARIFSKDGFSFRRFLALELLFLLLFNANNYSNSLSLGRVSTSASLTLHSFEVSLVYLMSRLFLGEKFALIKTLGVFMATGGVVLIALDNEFAADILGILFSLFACFASSIYKVSFKRLCGNASLGQSSLFLSGMGLVNLVVNFVPAYLLLHFGVETFQFRLIPWPKLIAFIFLTFVFNFATIFGLALLSPVVIAIGLLCGVPLSIGIDLAFRRLLPSWTFLLGASFLLLSALLATFHEQIRGQMPLGRKRKDEKEKDGWNEEAKQLADQELADCEQNKNQNC